MAEQKHVSGMVVGPHLSEDQHDAIRATRERRRAVAQANAEKLAGTRDESSQGTPEQSQQSEHVHYPES